MDHLFLIWDVDESGVISHQEMRNGLQKLGFNPTISLSNEDWEEFTLHGMLADENGEVNHENFDVAMRFQMAEYSQRILANKMQQCIKTDFEFAPVIFSMKMVCLEVIKVQSVYALNVTSTRV